MIYRVTVWHHELHLLEISGLLIATLSSDYAQKQIDRGTNTERLMIRMVWIA